LILAGGTIIANGSADELARRTATDAEVKWTQDGQRFIHSTPDPTGFVRELLQNHDVTDLEVHRANLEDAYMALVHGVESGRADAVRQFEVVTR
jgi:ABC-2 type transport system ATP-binding protein